MALTVSSYISISSGITGITAGVRSSTSSDSQDDRLRLSQSSDSLSDRVEISAEARQIGQNAQIPKDSQQPETSTVPSDVSSSEQLTQEEYQKLTSLKTRDREVRTHEQAHLAAAGQYAAGGASFTFQLGPDGNRYAVSGEVPVDMSDESSPQETIRKMERIRSAALAPAQPSSADRQIAAQASMKASQARQEVMMSSQGELLKNSGIAPDATSDHAEEGDNNKTGSVNVQPSHSAYNGKLINVMIRTYSAMQTLSRHP